MHRIVAHRYLAQFLRHAEGGRARRRGTTHRRQGIAQQSDHRPHTYRLYQHGRILGGIKGHGRMYILVGGVTAWTFDIVVPIGSFFLVVVCGALSSFVSY